MFKSVAKSIVHCGLLFILFYFTLAQGSDICHFNGLVPESNQWEENEFSVLSMEDEKTSTYLLMTRIIGQIAAADSSILRSQSCEVSKYVKALIKYYDKNATSIYKSHKNIADLLSFIKAKKLRNE